MPNSPTKSADSGPRKRLYRKSPVPRSDYVTIEQFAKDLDIDVDRVQSLIDHHYLRVMSAGETLAETVIARPAKSAMDWLRSMFTPLELRPLIPMKDITDALGITDDDFRYMCVTDNIPLHIDPVFGELMSVTSFYALQKSWIKMIHPMRSDRQALMLMLGILKGAYPRGRMKPLPFSDRLDKEISRIAKLPEPDRSLRATDLWAAYNEADTITDCLDILFENRKEKRKARLDERINVVERRLSGQGWKKEPTASADGEASDA